MATKATSQVKRNQGKKTRKGIHAKSKETFNKNSTNYKKPNVGQGKKR